MDQLQDVRALAEGVKGWLTDGEGALLYDFARRCTGRGAIVEIGSWHGRSTIYLAKGSEAGARVPVYAVDPHTGSPEHHDRYGDVWTFDVFKANIARAGVGDLVRPLVMTSEDAARQFDGPVELLFIDGDHAYEAVRSDWELWSPRLVTGGWVVLHDTGESWGGPRRIVRERIFGSREYRDIGYVDGITYAERADLGALEYARNRAIAASHRVAQRLDLPPAVRKAGKRLLRYNVRG